MAVNKAILLGNLGADPEVKTLDGGVKVANFSLATTIRGYKTANGQEVPDRTEWHRIVLWRGLAEVAEKYLHKGSQVYIEGEIRYRNYDDANGVKHFITEIYASEMQMLGSKPTTTTAATDTNNEESIPF